MGAGSRCPSGPILDTVARRRGARTVTFQRRGIVARMRSLVAKHGNRSATEFGAPRCWRLGIDIEAATTSCAAV